MQIIPHILNFMRSAKRWRRVASVRQAIDLARIVDRDCSSIAPFYSMSAPLASSKKVLFASFLPLPYVLKMEGIFSRLLQAHGWEGYCLTMTGDRMINQYHKGVFGNRAVNIIQYIPWGNYRTIARTIDAVLKGGYDSIREFRHRGSLVGINALASLSGVETSGSASIQGAAYRTLRALMIRSCLFSDACRRLLDDIRPDLVLAVEKGGIGNCEIFYQALERKTDYVQWLGCHEPEAIMLKRYSWDNARSHPFSISAATWATMCNSPWHDEYRSSVLREFEEGYLDNKWFKYKKLTDHTKLYTRDEIVAKLGLDSSKPLSVIFSPILNDANLFYGKDLFAGGFREWLVETVRTAMRNDRVSWVLKLHPANLYRRANMEYTGEYGELIAIKQALGSIPRDLKIIYPDDDINPLSIFKSLHCALTVRGTIGAEVPCFGKPVLTAGTGRYSGLGFTNDSRTAEEYLQKVLTIQTIPALSEQETRLAIRHAYLFFKVRPAKYDSFAKDVYAYPQGHPFNRDLRFKSVKVSDIISNPQAMAMIDWLRSGRDEDFLST